MVEPSNTLSFDSQGNAHVTPKSQEVVLEFVRTADGEIIPRGPIGDRSVYTTPKGRIINMDLEGLPVQLGPKPEVIKISAGAHSY